MMQNGSKLKSKNKVYEVQKKYQQLADYCYSFKRDYLPLAGNDEKNSNGFYQ